MCPGQKSVPRNSISARTCIAQDKVVSLRQRDMSSRSGRRYAGRQGGHASETLGYSGICVRNANNSIRKPLSSHAASLAFEGELSSGASVLRVSVQQFRAVLPSSSGAAPRAEHMARCSDHRGQGPRPGPVPRAPRGLLHPRAVVEGEEAENDSGGASIAPRARPRMRVAALPSHRIDPAAPLAHTAQTRSCPNAAPALLARSLGSRARQRLHQQLPSR